MLWEVFNRLEFPCGWFNMKESQASPAPESFVFAQTNSEDAPMHSLHYRISITITCLQVRRVDQTRYPMTVVASLSAVPQSCRTPLQHSSKRAHDLKLKSRCSLGSPHTHTHTHAHTRTPGKPWWRVLPGDINSKQNQGLRRDIKDENVKGGLQ